MEPMKLYFDVRDIFRAPRLALSGKKNLDFSRCQSDWICLLFYSQLHCPSTFWSFLWPNLVHPRALSMFISCWWSLVCLADLLGWCFGLVFCHSPGLYSRVPCYIQTIERG